MSEDDGFLARWSRRKRSAATRRRGSPTPQISADATETVATASPQREFGEPPNEPPVLPPIESLDAASDVTPFLAPGVPADLMRQALRKAWQSDPAIRDFIGLSENSWDFNAPDGVPGFGSLTEREVRRLIEGVIGNPASIDPSPDAPPPAGADLPTAPTGDATLAQIGAATPVSATRPAADPETPRMADAGRRHGGALPK